MEIDRQYIRHIVWDYLKRNPVAQMNSILNGVKTTIGAEMFHNRVVKMIHEEVFTLSKNGLVMFAKVFLEDGGAGFPWITVTECGKLCFESSEFTPYDPDGYIGKVKEMIPSIDGITMKYVAESINAFNRHAPVSTTITLGIASEQAMLLLIEAYVSALKNEEERNNLLKRINGRFIAV